MRICETCGALFEAKPWQVKYQRDKLCPTCTPPDPRHDAEYRRARRKRMVLAGGKCEQCGSTRKLQAHHVNGKAGDHRVANLRILCLLCHQAQTVAQLKAQGRRFEPAVGALVSTRPRRSKYRKPSHKATKSMRLV